MIRLLALALFVTGCGGRPLPLYVEDDPDLVAATEEAVADLEQYLGPGAFDTRAGEAAPIRMLLNPRGGISIRNVPDVRPYRTLNGQAFRPAWQWGFIRVRDGVRSNTIAHEIGHSLSLPHSDDPTNLMHDPSPPPGEWHLTLDQVERMQRGLSLL